MNDRKTNKMFAPRENRGLRGGRRGWFPGVGSGLLCFGFIVVAGVAQASGVQGRMGEGHFGYRGPETSPVTVRDPLADLKGCCDSPGSEGRTEEAPPRAPGGSRGRQAGAEAERNGRASSAAAGSAGIPLSVLRPGSDRIRPRVDGVARRYLGVGW